MGTAAPSAATIPHFRGREWCKLRIFSGRAPVLHRRHRRLRAATSRPQRRAPTQADRRSRLRGTSSNAPTMCSPRVDTAHPLASAEHRRPAHRIPARRARRARRRSAIRCRSSRAGSTKRSRARVARAERDDARHRRRRRPAGGAHRAAQGRRRARLRVLHQLREPQGPRARRASARRAAVPLGRARAPGAHRRHGRKARAAPSPTPTSRRRPRPSRLGAWASPQSAPIAGPRVRSKRAFADVAASVRGGRRCDAAAAALGRLSLVPDAFEFWQGRALAAARPHRYRARRRARGAIGRLAP